MASIKVHGVPMSTATMRVLATLYEKDLQFELIPVDMRAGAHKQEAHLALNVTPFSLSLFTNKQNWKHFMFGFSNYLTMIFVLFQPFGQIPALEDGDLTLFGQFTFALINDLTFLDLQKHHYALVTLYWITIYLKWQTVMIIFVAESFCW